MKPLHTLLWLALLFVITFTLIVPLLCISLPFSKFYYLYNKQDDVTRKAELLNSERYKRSLAYFSSLHSETSKLFYLNMKKSGHLDLVVAIITVKRKDGTLGYLTQSVAKMDKLLKEDRNFERKFMFICNVDQDLYGHEEARKLEKFIPVEYRFKNSTEILHNSPHKVLYHLQKNFDTYQKETIDYMFCLEMAYSMNPDYVLLVEDDTLPLPMALDVANTKLRWLTLFRSEPMKNFAFIKLYYPPKWQGFGNEMRRILEVIAIGMNGRGQYISVVVCDSDESTVHQVLYLL